MAKTAVVLVLWISLARCGGITAPSAPAIQEGEIVERNRPTSFEKERPTIWVKDPVNEECGVVYVITPSTDLFTRAGRGGIEEIGVERLIVGATVRAWTDIVLTSCPGQARAEAIELVSSS